MAHVEPEVEPEAEDRTPEPPAAPPGPTAEQIQAQRELAVARAGVNLATPVGQMFARGYDGPIDDAEKILEAAAQVGAYVAPETDDAPPPEDNGGAARQEAASGAEFTPPPETPKDVYGDAIRFGNELRAQGNTEEDAMAAAFKAIFGAGAEGDASVLLDNRHGKRKAEWDKAGILA